MQLVNGTNSKRIISFWSDFEYSVLQVTIYLERDVMSIRQSIDISA